MRFKPVIGQKRIITIKCIQWFLFNCRSKQLTQRLNFQLFFRVNTHCVRVSANRISVSAYKQTNTIKSV